MRHQPIRQLPPDYRPNQIVRVLDEQVMQTLGRYNLYLIPPFLLGGFLWRHLAQSMTITPHIELNLIDKALLLIITVTVTLTLHELIHGAVMFWAGHKPRFGVFYSGKIPVALYATTDNGYFQRTLFLIMALAPLVVITLLSMGLMLVLPANLHIFLIIALVINGSGAVGDLYMSRLVWKYPEANTLIQDHSEGITIFIAPDKSAT